MIQTRILLTALDVALSTVLLTVAEHVPIHLAPWLAHLAATLITALFTCAIWAGPADSWERRRRGPVPFPTRSFSPAAPARPAGVERTDSAPAVNA